MKINTFQVTIASGNDVTREQLTNLVVDGLCYTDDRPTSCLGDCVEVEKVSHEQPPAVGYCLTCDHMVRVEIKYGEAVCEHCNIPIGRR